MNWTEDIVVFYRSLPTFNPQMVYTNNRPAKVGYSEIRKTHSGVMGKCGGHEGYVTYNDGYTYPSSVLEFGSINGWGNQQPKYKHPTQKPVDLIRYLIRTYTNSSDIVLDNCMGSGTTAIAALREGRKYIGFELDKKYYEMTQQRIAEEKDYIELTDNKLF
jgi:DNA modification methylase